MNINNHTLDIIVNGVSVDMYDEGVNLRMNRIIADPTKISTNQSEYSFTFNLPITPTNSQIFNYSNISSKRNKFSGRYKCEVLADNISIFDGTLKVTEISEGSFKCNLFKTKVNTLESIFGDSTMNEIDWKVPFKGTSTINAVNSDMTTKYFFPLVAYSLFNKFPDITTQSGNRKYTDKYDIDYTNVFYYNTYVPSLNLVEVLKKCCELKGYQLGGDIISDEILNDIYLSNFIADQQDPLYNYGDPDMGQTSIEIDWKNYDAAGNFDESKMIEYPLGFVQRTRKEPISGYNNYDTAFVWNMLDSTNKVVSIGQNNSRMYVNGGIQIPADGYYEITMDMDIGIPETQGTITAQQCTEYLPAWSGEGLNGEEISWEEARKYEQVQMEYSLDNMPVEVQLCKYSASDGEVNSINHNIIFYGKYPNESDYQAQITDMNTASIRVGSYYNTQVDSIEAFPAIDGNPSAVAIDTYNNPDFVCGMSQSTYGRNFAYIKNGYSWHSDYQDTDNASYYNMKGYYFVYTDFDLTGGILGWTTGFTETNVNENNLNGSDVWYPTAMGRRTKGTLKQIVRLNKNDMLVPFCQTRGYVVDSDTSVSLVNVYYKADAKVKLKVRAVAPYTTSYKKLSYNMSSLFDKDLNLGNFNNNQQKIADFFNDVQKAFNLGFEQDGINIILNKNKISNNVTVPVDIDKKTNTMDATFSAIDFPRNVEVKWSIDTEEEGFYRSVEDNTNEEQMQSNNWKDYGDYGYQKVPISNADDAQDLAQSVGFSYCWYRPFNYTLSGTTAPEETGTTSNELIVTLTGELNRTGVGTDSGCDSDDDGIDDLYKPHSIIFDSNIQYKISGVNVIPEQLKFTVKSSRLHLGKHMEGTETYTPTSIEGEIIPPPAVDLINDKLCYQVEQMLSVESVDITLESGTPYTLKIIDNVIYTDDSMNANTASTYNMRNTFAMARSGSISFPCDNDILAFEFSGSNYRYYLWGERVVYDSPYSVSVTSLIPDNTSWGNLQLNFYKDTTLTRVVSIPCTNGMTSMTNLFNGNDKLTELDVIRTFDTSNVGAMDRMFRNCSGLISLDFSSFDTTNVTSMNGMFEGCRSLRELDLSYFNTLNVIYYEKMFKDCVRLNSIDTSNFKTFKSIDMNEMFYNCQGLITLDLSHFDTTNLQYANEMFRYCYNLRELNLSGWNTSKLEEVQYMFGSCKDLETLNVSGWDVRKINSTYLSTDIPIHLFTNCTSLSNLIIGDVDEFTYNWWCARLSEVGISCSIIDYGIVEDDDEDDVTSGCTDDLSIVFTGTSLTYEVNGTTYTATSSPYSTKLSDNGVTTFYDASGMFMNQSGLREVKKMPCTIDVIDMSNMFNGCIELEKLNTENFKTHNVINMNAMFKNCNRVSNLDLIFFNTSNVNNMSEMFSHCNSLQTIVCSQFDTRNVFTISDMFSDCYSLYSINLNGWHTSNMFNMSNVFRNCTNVTTINVTGWDVLQVTNYNGMFFGCDSLNLLILGKVTQEEFDWWCARLTEANISCDAINYTLIGEGEEGGGEGGGETTGSTSGDTADGLYIPVIGKTEWWIEGYKYEEMAKYDGRGLKQRFWFRNSPTQWTLPTQGEMYRITTTSNQKQYANGNMIYLNYNNGVNTLLGKYFNINLDSGSDQVEIDVYLTPMEYKLISMGSSVHFDDNIYKVLQIQGYDPSGENPTKLVLISI